MTTSQDQKLSRGALTALVVGCMIGSGIFALPSAFGRSTGGLGALVAWAIAGTVLMLALAFQTLSRRRPDLDTGIYAYAKAGFGNYLGFASAVGYWIGCCLADVARLVLIKATLGQFFPVFGDGSTAVAILSASVIFWGVHVLVLRGVKEGRRLLNTIAKIVPIAVFLVVAIAGFKADIFAWNFWGGEERSLASQVRPSFLARENPNQVSAAALWLTNIVLVTWFAEYAFTRALKMTRSMTLIPYLLVAAYGLKLAWTGKTYEQSEGSRTSDGVRGAIATLDAAGMIYAGGLTFLLLSAILYAPGTVLYFLARREQKERTFTEPERIVFGAITV